MKNLKRLTAVLFSAILLANAWVLAEEPEVLNSLSEDSTEIDIENPFDNVYDSSIGRISAVGEDSVEIVVGQDTKYILDISEDTELLSGELLPIELADIENDMYVSAVYEKAMTKSLPPRAFAVMLVAAKDVSDLPIYGEIAFCESNDDEFIIETSIPDAQLIMAKNTKVTPLKTKNILTLSDCSQGDRIFFYSKQMMPSEPPKYLVTDIVMIENKQHEIHKDDFISAEDESKPVTRAEFCFAAYDLLCEMTDLDMGMTNNEYFADTSDYRLNKLCELGIVYGMGDNKFEPEAVITREAAFTIADRICNKGFQICVSAALRNADDADKISDWAEDSVATMDALGLYDKAWENPKEALTVGETKILLSNMADLYENR